VAETGAGDVEYRQRTKNGDYRWLSNHMALIRDAAGRPLYRIGTIRDITDRKRDEEALREKDYLLTESQRLAKVGSLKLDCSTGDVTYSDEMLRILGLSPGSNVRELQGIIRPEDRQRKEDAIKDAIDHNKPYSCEYRIVLPDGTLRHIKAVGDATRDCRGNPLTFTATIQDITEHKRIEDALRESEFHLARAQQIAHMGSWTWDVVNDQMYWSDEIYRLIGLAPGEFSPGINDFIAFVHPEDRDGVTAAVLETLVHGFYDIDFRIVRKGGEERYIHSEGTVTYALAGDPVTMEGIVQDITSAAGRGSRPGIETSPSLITYAPSASSNSISRLCFTR